MTTFRQTLGRLARLTPPIAALISERDRLRDENRQLRSQLGHRGPTIPTHHMPDTVVKAPIREEPLATCTPEIFAHAVSDQGVIVLRSAIDQRKLSYFRVRIDSAIEYYASLTEADMAKLDYQRWWPGNAIEFSVNASQLGHLSDPMLQDATQGALSFYDLISDPAFHALIGGAFPEVIFRRSSVTTCRRISAQGSHSAPGFAGAVPLHCDLHYHKSGPFGLNFWIPLEPAGEKFGRPGLEIAPFGFASVSRYLEFDGHSFASFDSAKFKPENVEAAFGVNALERTNLDVGDVMVFTCWTLHRTYVPDDAVASRLSAEVRMYTETLPAKRME